MSQAQLGEFSSSNFNSHLPKRRVSTASPLKAHSTQNVNSFQNYESNLNDDSLNSRFDSTETIAYRPMTSNAFRVPFNLSDPIGSSHYNEVFYPKIVKKEDPIPIDPNRKNNPHPSKEFMVFRFRPLKPIENPLSDWSQPVGDQLIAQVIKNQMKSTYSTDYVNNVEEKAKFVEREKQLPRPSYSSRVMQWQRSRNSEQLKHRPPIIFNNPFSFQSIYPSPTRYGSNIKQHQSAYGIVPECSRFWHDLKIDQKH